MLLNKHALIETFKTIRDIAEGKGGTDEFYLRCKKIISRSKEIASIQKSGRMVTWNLVLPFSPETINSNCSSILAGYTDDLFLAKFEIWIESPQKDPEIEVRLTAIIEKLSKISNDGEGDDVFENSYIALNFES